MLSKDRAVLAPIDLGTETWTSFAATNYALCGIAADGTLRCRGGNQFGQMGIPGIVQSQDLLQVGDASDWEQLSADSNVMCGIRTGGNAYCWGRNARAQMGTLPLVTTPARPSAATFIGSSLGSGPR